MIAIADYGMGNVRSVQKALERLGFEAVITADSEQLASATHVILPGVGAAADAMQRIRETGIDRAVQRAAQQGRPVLGICLGMQLLFEKSLENGGTECLGLIPGQVVPFDRAKTGTLRIPHMGWNDVAGTGRGLIAQGEDPCVYFVHSYHAADVPDENVAAVCTYGYPFVCAVSGGSVHGTQFHPEKSGSAGLELLRRFAANGGLT